MMLFEKKVLSCRTFHILQEIKKQSDRNMADEKIIFSMNGVGKVLPHNNKVILKDIYLSFFYGAKIGIIGLNGSGKSTLMKIIAGVEKSYQGEVVWAPGYTVGYLEQEPRMDPDKTVIEVVREGVQEVAGGRRPAEGIRGYQYEVRRAHVGRRDERTHRASG